MLNYVSKRGHRVYQLPGSYYNITYLSKTQLKLQSHKMLLVYTAHLSYQIKLKYHRRALSNIFNTTAKQAESKWDFARFELQDQLWTGNLYGNMSSLRQFPH